VFSRCAGGGSVEHEARHWWAAVFGIALGYEMNDLTNSPDRCWRCWAGKLEARREACARWPASRRGTGWAEHDGGRRVSQDQSQHDGIKRL